MACIGVANVSRECKVTAPFYSSETISHKALVTSLSLVKHPHICSDHMPMMAQHHHRKTTTKTKQNITPRVMFCGVGISIGFNISVTSLIVQTGQEDQLTPILFRFVCTTPFCNLLSDVQILVNRRQSLTVHGTVTRIYSLGEAEVPAHITILRTNHASCLMLTFNIDRMVFTSEKTYRHNI